MFILIPSDLNCIKTDIRSLYVYIIQYGLFFLFSYVLIPELDCTANNKLEYKHTFVFFSHLLLLFGHNYLFGNWKL